MIYGGFSIFEVSKKNKKSQNIKPWDFINLNAQSLKSKFSNRYSTILNHFTHLILFLGGQYFPGESP
ncbi:hypothetical protein H4V97_001598 [Flavobacterium sp. CG_23.5]|nr:hypothetical protein [Flavobacterium sp. CG_9.10]MBP2283280.1 hypothetical protein [Flavobacterium sp. CG_23.5]